MVSAPLSSHQERCLRPRFRSVTGGHRKPGTAHDITVRRVTDATRPARPGLRGPIETSAAPHTLSASTTARPTTPHSRVVAGPIPVTGWRNTP